MTQTISDRGGHYAITIKGNQSKLTAEASIALDKAAAGKATKFHQTKEDAHGPHEVRRAFVIPFAQPPSKNALVDLCAVGRVESRRTVDGKTRTSSAAMRCRAKCRHTNCSPQYAATGASRMICTGNSRSARRRSNQRPQEQYGRESRHTSPPHSQCSQSRS
ncbi:hypothetical protein [Mesorhizobium sp. M0029]|uniref:hypothetical protein n=1 Tax=Mesorhizobium sp. M0029 TaxID=2956850 RepID=UPI00333DA713